MDLQPALVKLKLNTEPSSGTFRLQDHQGRWHTGSLPAEVELPLGDYLVHFSLDGKTRSERVRLDQYEVGGIATFGVFASSQLQLLTSRREPKYGLMAFFGANSPYGSTGLDMAKLESSFGWTALEPSKRQMNLAPDQVQTIRYSLLPAKLDSRLK